MSGLGRLILVYFLSRDEAETLFIGTIRIHRRLTLRSDKCGLGHLRCNTFLNLFCLVKVSSSN